MQLPEEVVVREHALAAGVGLLCLHGGGVRDIMSLHHIECSRSRSEVANT